MDLRKCIRQVLEEFINIYKSEPCLWRIKSKGYHDKGKRDAAYGKLEKKLKQIDPSADRDKVVRKINSLRTTYRKEKLKVQRSTHSREPTLWYYHLFDFLADEDIHRTSPTNVNENKATEDDQSTEDLHDYLELSFVESKPELDPLKVHEESDTLSHDSNQLLSAPLQQNQHARALKRSVPDTCDSILKSIEEMIKKPKLSEDRHDAFGKIVSVKLRDIDNNKQRLLAEKLITDALFMAEMGQLTLSHSIISSNPVSNSNTWPNQL